ncbi:MAG: Rrf2 family transcriptional regulator [candidate division Zixibacteria bacterium]|nr:Rrf2 family transcriptional regulator [candidate division Zixibacteria bacterium]
MKVTAQEEYGLRCILQLARHYGGEPLGGRMIAEAEGLSVDYVTKLLMILRRGDLVQSVRGIKGGFALSRHPRFVTVGQVMRTLSVEDGLVLTSPESHLCNHFSGQLETCVHLGGCGIRPVWTILSRYISNMLDQISLLDLLQEEVQVMDVMEHVSSDVQPERMTAERTS